MKLKANKKRNTTFNTRQLWNTFRREISWMDTLDGETAILKDLWVLTGLALVIHVVRKQLGRKMW